MFYRLNNRTAILLIVYKLVNARGAIDLQQALYVYCGGAEANIVATNTLSADRNLRAWAR